MARTCEQCKFCISLEKRANWPQEWSCKIKYSDMNFPAWMEIKPEYKYSGDGSPREICNVTKVQAERCKTFKAHEPEYEI